MLARGKNATAVLTENRKPLGLRYGSKSIVYGEFTNLVILIMLTRGKNTTAVLTENRKPLGLRFGSKSIVYGEFYPSGDPHNVSPR